MPERIDPQMAGSDPRMEEYFVSDQFGLDKNVLIGVMLQFKNSEKEKCFELEKRLFELRDKCYEGRKKCGCLK